MKLCGSLINKAVDAKKQWLLKRSTAADQELSGGCQEGKGTFGRGSNNKADHGSLLTRSCCLGLHTRLGSDFFPTDNGSDKDCW